MAKSIKITFPPYWDEIVQARNKTNLFLISQGLSREIINDVSLVSTELVENALKFGYYPRPEISINYSIEMIKSKIKMEIKHPLREKNGLFVKELQKMLKSIKSSKDIDKTYKSRIKQIKDNLENEQKGDNRIGLIRIAAEGKTMIDFKVEKKTITVTAIYNIKKK